MYPPTEQTNEALILICDDYAQETTQRSCMTNTLLKCFVKEQRSLGVITGNSAYQVKCQFKTISAAHILYWTQTTTPYTNNDIDKMNILPRRTTKLFITRNRYVILQEVSPTHAKLTEICWTGKRRDKQTNHSTQTNIDPYCVLQCSYLMVLNITRGQETKQKVN